MKNLHTLVLLFLAIIANAQTITGKILNESQPIPYARIGVEGENIGAIADKDGNFQLSLDNIDRNKVVKIEVAGFEVYKTSVSDFVKINPQNIQLKEKVREITEVKISPKKLVDKNWGVNSKSKSILYSVDPQLRKDEYLRETAVEFETKKKTKINKININIANFFPKSPVVLRYCIYDNDNGLPGKLLIDEEITAELTKEKIVNGTFSLDVSKNNIWVNGNFFVGIQFMNDFEGGIYISAALMRPGFTRSFYGGWKKFSIAAPAINIDVKVDKNYRNEVEESRKAISDKDEKAFIEKYKNH